MDHVQESKTYKVRRDHGMYGLLLVTISLVVGVIIGSTSYNSFGAGTEKPFHQLLHQTMAVMDKGMKAAI